MKLLKMIFILGLAGCATTQRPAPQSGPGPQVQMDFGSSSLEAVNKGACRVAGSNYEKTKSKDLLTEANSCAAAEKWRQLSDIGQELAIRDVKSPWGAFYLSLVAEHDEKFERAIWLSDLASKKAPDMGLFHYQRARILWRKSEFKTATDALIKAVSLDTNLIDAHLFLGQIFFRDQDFSRAARHFQAVLRVRPKDPTALTGLAECHIQTGDARSALEYLERGDRAFSSEPIFQVRITYVNEHMLNDVPKALEIYRKIRADFGSGKYTRQLSFDLDGKIQDLEFSVKGSRAIAGSQSSPEVAK